MVNTELRVNVDIESEKSTVDSHVISNIDVNVRVRSIVNELSIDADVDVSEGTVEESKGTVDVDDEGVSTAVIGQ